MIRRVEQEVGGTNESPANWWRGKEKKPKAGLFEGFVENASWPGFAGIAQMSVPLVTSFPYICPSPESGKLHYTLGVSQVARTLFSWVIFLRGDIHV